MCTLATMLLGTPSFLAPGISSLLLLFISLVDDDPECDEAEEGVLALLPPLASTLRIGRTTCRSRLRVIYFQDRVQLQTFFTFPAGALDVLLEGAAELGLFLDTKVLVKIHP